MERSGATRSSEPIIDATRQNATVTPSAAAGSPAALSGAAMFRNGTVPSFAMAFSTLGAEMRHCSACERDAMMMPICVGSASGHAISETTPIDASPPPARRRRRRSPAAYTAPGPPFRNARSATAPHMIMYVLYITALMLIAARVPHGMDTSGRLSEFARGWREFPRSTGKHREHVREGDPLGVPGPSCRSTFASTDR